MLISKELKPYFRALAFLGLLLLLGDLALSAQFGWTMGVDMAVIVGGISLASGLFPVVAIFFNRVGWKALSYGLAAVWVPVFCFNVWSNMGVSTANRLGEVQQAQKVRTDYDAILKGREEIEGKLAVLTRQREELPRQLQALTETKVGDWSVAAMPSSPEELDAAIKQKKKAVENEAARGGCGRLCEQRMAELAHMEALRAKAAEIKDLDRRIAVTMDALERTKDELKHADKGISTTLNQSTGHANLIAMEFGIAPNDRMVAIANEVNGMVVAFILAIAAMGTTLAGAFPHLMRVGKVTIIPREITDVGEDMDHPQLEQMHHARSELREPRRSGYDFDQRIVKLRDLASGRQPALA